jgi:hypothetical protein
MTQPLAKIEAQPMAKPAVLGELERAIQMIMKAAADPDVSVDKMRELYAFAKEIETDRARKAFFAALSDLQAKLPQIPKHGHGHNTRYARYEDIDTLVRPLLAEHGFALAFDSKAPSVDNDKAKWTFSCVLSHRDGHTETKCLFLPVDQSGGKNPVQAMGSTVSYARRYLLEMHLNLVKVDEDDDGNGGGATITQAQADEIRRGLEAAKGDPARFFKLFEVTRFEDIQARDYKRAMLFVESKRSAVKP